MNILEVREVARTALEDIRRRRPIIPEVMTYRFRGHSMGDPERYRKAEEVHKWQENDPIGITTATLWKKIAKALSWMSR
jgi:pyruvate dehydrogenase E1 component alpha subunit